MLISKSSTDVAKIIHHGGVVAYPTEAVFGLGCDPANEHAVKQLLQVKKRPIEKGLILIAADIEQLSAYISPPSDSLASKLLSKDKPTTWLVPALSTAPQWITGEHQMIAVRITHHSASQTLCQACGHPLVSTSANPSKQLPAKTKQTVIAYFNSIIDAIFDAPVGKQQSPSEIRNSQTGDVIRKG